MTKHHRYIRAISGALIAALLIYFSYHQWRGGKATPDAMAAPTVLVTASPVVVEDAPITINVFGSLRAVNSAAIASEMDGPIVELDFTEGESVTVGTTLLRLDDVLEKAELAKARADLELNTVQYARMQSLLKNKATSQQEYDQAKADLAVSSAQVEIASANLEKTLIKAPFDGVLGARKLSVGQYVTAGEALVDIFDARHLKLEYSVSERFLGQVVVGQTVDLTTSAYPDTVFTGTVDFIAPNIDANTRTLAVEAVIDNSDGRLSPGLSMRLVHVLGHKEKSIKIPEESILPTVEGYRVYVIQEDIANGVSVEIESRTKGFVYITKGLKPGDIVVTSGQEKLRDGAKVEILATENKEV
jgi:membrane fusion protein, multidrug efflux system